MDYIFPIITALMALGLWNTKFRAISVLLVADFIWFFAFDEWWIHSSLPGGEWMFPYKGVLYILFFGLYMILNTKLSFWLAGLSALAGLVHCSNPILLHYGTGLTVGNYELIMGIYCWLQLVIFLVGVGYDDVHSWFSNFSWLHPHNHSRKGT